MFLAKFCKNLIAVDGSKIAIEDCKKRSSQKGIKNIEFIDSFVEDSNLVQKIQSKFKFAEIPLEINIYSRFFLHSISEEDENEVIILISKLLGNNKGSIYLEFRTTQDEFLSKYTGSHFRRYIDPEILINKFSKYGFSVRYSVEGLGFAKYKVDDAYVARLVLSKD